MHLAYSMKFDSFYPVFPVPLDAMHEVNLDVSHSESLNITEENDVAPHVLVLPSKLKQFVKVCRLFACCIITTYRNNKIRVLRILR